MLKRFGIDQDLHGCKTTKNPILFNMTIYDKPLRQTYNEDFGPGLACGLRSQSWPSLALSRSLALAKVSLERELQLESAGVYRCE